MPISDPDVEFVLGNADRLITVTIRCVISFGLADGLNDRLLATPTAMSKGDMRGACKSYMRAQKMGSTKS
jgi:hypothetical protein